MLDAEERVDPSWTASIGRLLDSGITVAAIRDTPRMPQDVPACLSDNESDPAVCGVDTGRTLAGLNPAEQAMEAPNLIHLDFTDLLCPDGFCSPVIGNVLVYIDRDHLTSTYVESMRPMFEDRLDAGLRLSGSEAAGRLMEVPEP